MKIIKEYEKKKKKSSKKMVDIRDNVKSEIGLSKEILKFRRRVAQRLAVI